MDLNKSKMKNIKAWLELEPNFHGVATHQSSEFDYTPLVNEAVNELSA